MNTESNTTSAGAEAGTMSRRQVLGGTALATAGFLFLPGRALGLDGAKSPNEKLNIAGIGIGGKGKDDLAALASENIVALCDVDWGYAGPVFDRNPNAKRFKDYRKMLDEMPEIDAVVIATPDHHHAPAAMAAIQHGKHLYCEQPLTHSVGEARLVAEAARKAKVATQMGNSGQASAETRRLCELVWAGAIETCWKPTSGPTDCRTGCSTSIGRRECTGQATSRPCPARWTGTCGWDPRRTDRFIPPIRNGSRHARAARRRAPTSIGPARRPRLSC